MKVRPPSSLGRLLSIVSRKLSDTTGRIETLSNSEGEITQQLKPGLLCGVAIQFFICVSSCHNIFLCAYGVAS